MPSIVPPIVSETAHASVLERLFYSASRRWLLLLNLLLGLFVGLPWLAPIFMHVGWIDAGNVMYAIYAPQCHQLPQRSFFLFGPKLSYSLAEIQTAWRETNNPLVLRHFIGDHELGWKLAWSDRMVAMYTSMFVAGVVYWPVRRHLKPARLHVFALLVLPMLIDGSTHALSDLSGIGLGFRASNSWLAILTNNALSPMFYAGDSLGTFNSWMRLLTGMVFGVGAIWFAYPRLEQLLRSISRDHVRHS